VIERFEKVFPIRELIEKLFFIERTGVIIIAFTISFALPKERRDPRIADDVSIRR